MSLAPPTVFELRQYTLHPGQREVLIELFEHEFIEPQEALGAQVIGQFRDLDRPDHFVWLRGFADMAVRAQSLAAFYGGPVWRAHRDAANATMLDSDDVLLLKPAWEGSGFAMAARAEPPASGGGVLHATICPLTHPADAALLGAVEHELLPSLRGAGASLHAVLITDPRPNNFPRLPVRENEPVLVWCTSGDAEAPLPDSVARHLAAPLQRLRLSPTARSALRA